MQKQFMGVAALGAALAIGNASQAQAVQWRVEDGGNGHWYAIVPAIPGMNAATFVAGAYVPGGHPVSISSARSRAPIRVRSAAVASSDPGSSASAIDSTCGRIPDNCGPDASRRGSALMPFTSEVMIAC